MILLIWFYFTGLMVLVGAVINSETEASAVDARIPSVAPFQESQSQFHFPIAPAA